MACACLIAVRACSHFLRAIASWAALSGLPTLALTACCAGADAGARSSAAVVNGAAAIASSELSTIVAFVILCLTRRYGIVYQNKSRRSLNAPGSFVIESYHDGQRRPSATVYMNCSLPTKPILFR